MTLALVYVAAGLVLLTVAADRLVVAAARVARALGVSVVLIGALVIGAGTSAPELLVSVVAALRGELDMAVGNVIGSNVANLTLVLGAAVVIRPAAGHLHTIRREGVLMALAVAGFVAVTWDGTLSVSEGAILATAGIGATLLLLFWSRADAGSRIGVVDMTEGGLGTGAELAIAVAALAATLGGADLLVRGARTIAEVLDLSEGFIGLTLVAIGTSLPELATAVAAARRGQNDLLIGNVLGSNIFNSLGVAGAAGIAGGGAIAGFHPTLAFSVAAAALAGTLAATGNKLVRWEGILLVAAFAGFIALAF